MAAKVYKDIQQKDNDLYINPATGDFSIVPSDNQHIMDILQSEQGWWKKYPLVGAAVRRLLKGKANSQIVESTMKQQLEADGYQVSRPVVTVDRTGKTIIQPNAVRVKF